MEYKAPYELAMLSSPLSPSDKDKWGKIVFLCVGVIIFAIAILVLVRKFMNSDFDPDTLCLMNKAVPHTVVIIDRTDPLSSGQIQHFRSQLGVVTSRLQMHERLSVYVISGMQDSWNPTAVFSKCRPKSGKEASWWIETPTKIEQEYERGFGGPLFEAIDRQGLGKSARTASPIFQVIQAISIKPEFLERPAQRRSLLIVSDMMEHTSRYSHYRSPIDHSAFFTTDLWTSWRADLQGVEVDVLYLERQTLGNTYQTEQHTKFWHEYFSRSGANVRTFTPIR